MSVQLVPPRSPHAEDALPSESRKNQLKSHRKVNPQGVVVLARHEALSCFSIRFVLTKRLTLASAEGETALLALEAREPLLPGHFFPRDLRPTFYCVTERKNRRMDGGIGRIFLKQSSYIQVHSWFTWIGPINNLVSL